MARRQAGRVGQLIAEGGRYPASQARRRGSGGSRRVPGAPRSRLQGPLAAGASAGVTIR